MIESNNTNRDVLGEVFKQGESAEWDAKTFLVCTHVCKLWKEIFSKGIVSENEVKEMFPNLFIFGANEWEKYFGEIDKVPAILPRRIVQILKSPCPFTLATLTGEVADTHLLVWCPLSVGKKLRTINLMWNLAQSPLQDGYAVKDGEIWDEVVKQHGDVAAKSQWILLTGDILQGSRNISYDKQEKMVTDQPGYEVPTALNAITAMIARHVVTEEFIFDGFYTRCSDKVKYQGDDREGQITLGASWRYFYVSKPYEDAFTTVAAVRVF